MILRALIIVPMPIVMAALGVTAMSPLKLWACLFLEM